MKNRFFYRVLLFILASFIVLSSGLSQDSIPDFQMEERIKSVVVKNDRTEYIGYILKRDSREILMDVDNLGEIYIPMHEIQSIMELDASKDYSGGEIFATRYFFTTNGLALDKGERYALFNWWGPEVHSNVADNVTLGLMTTWVAVPLIGSIKFSFPVSDGFSLGAGLLAGTALWAGLTNVGALAYGSATLGNYTNNVTVSGGYIGLSFDGDRAGSPLMSVACMFRASQNFSIVGDSFIVIQKGSTVALIIPGIRYSKANTRAFQFGFGGLVASEESTAIPIPYFGFFRTF